METTDKHTYQPDDYVSYAGSGVCRVIGQETQSPDGTQEIQYYKLQPLDSKNSTYYVPVEHAEMRLRPLLTKAGNAGTSSTQFSVATTIGRSSA